MDRLCQCMQTEKEPHVFTDLVQQLNDLMERREKRLENNHSKLPDSHRSNPDFVIGSAIELLAHEAKVIPDAILLRDSCGQRARPEAHR